MRVGAVEETITVTGETPIVDVQNTRRQRVIDRETIDNIPTSRTAYDMAALIPGVSRGGLTSQDVGGSSSSGTPIGSVAIHGGRTGDQVVMRNGIETIGQSGNGFSTPVNINPVGTQEVNVDTASAGAEHTTGGIRINVIPREGGNTFNGAFFTSYASPSWQAENLTQELKDQGVSSADKLKDNYDINPGFGGPLKQDKLWFFVSARYKNSANYASGMYYDKNFNNPNVWVFEPDLDRPAANPSIWKGAQLRLTWQASQRNKFGVSLHEDSVSYAPTSVSQILAPEAAENRIYPVQRQRQVDWSSPVNNRILLEAGINRYKAASNLLPLSGLSPDMVPATEQSTDLKFRSLETHRLQPALTTHTRFSASYITGAHAMKVGHEPHPRLERVHLREPEPGQLPAQQRDSQPDQPAGVSDPDRHQHGPVGRVRAGQVDDQSPDRCLRRAIQPRHRQQPGAASRAVDLHARRAISTSRRWTTS